MLGSLESIYRPTLIDDLPVEIICQIFFHYIHEHPSCHCPPSPLLLCRVSSRWRHIAISLPYLWKHFHIDIAKCTKNAAGFISMGNLWIERSHLLPLSFSVSIESQSDFTLMYPFLRKFSSKFQTLSIHSYVLGWLFLTPYKQPSIDLQALNTLILNTYAGTSLYIPEPMPNLRRLRTCYPSNLLGPLPWAQLTHLDVTKYIEFSEFLQILSKCPSLIDGEFSINHQSISTDALVSYSVPILPRLNRLLLRNVPLSNLECLPSRSFEALEELGLASLRPSPGGFGTHNPICDNAKRLTFSMWPLKSEPPIRLLQKLETVTSLTMYCALNTKKMDVFLRAVATTPLLPHLTSFNLYLRAVNGFDLRLYKAFISDRWSAGPLSANTRLTKCSLIFISRQACERSLYNTMVVRLHELLKPLVDDGLDFLSDILDNFPSFAWSSF